MTRSPLALVTAAALAVSLTACGSDDSGSAEDGGSADAAAATSGTAAAAEGDSDGEVTLYSGRNEELVQPVLDAFSEETGIEVQVRYAGTAEMAAQLLEEGDNSPADAFLAQDAGALGAVNNEGLLVELPEQTLEQVPEIYRSEDGTWVGVTGRSRVLVYNKDAVEQDELPTSVADLTGAEWQGRVGIAPSNASFQSFVTAMRELEGDDAAADWLGAMAANDPQIRERNGVIVADVDSGAIDVGLVNHYYLYELATERGVPAEELDVALHFFSDGDTGALVNISGIALVGEQDDADAQSLVDYLLSEEGQTYFVEQTYEYPLIEGIDPPAGLPALDELETPQIDLNDLDDLQRTIEMITEAGLL